MNVRVIIGDSKLNRGRDIQLVCQLVQIYALTRSIQLQYAADRAENMHTKKSKIKK